ncbi:MAG: NAD-dependent epimerase/dehydratase family protein [Planctomycetota bacterium]|nr:MAG: NAD-dependent epimerase/dehydratase family protein [Planctomycetota bacterium]
MRYLITGGVGFIGSHLAESLLADGHEVVLLDDYSTGKHENVAHIDGHPHLRIVYGSVTDESITYECVREADAVFHLASAVGVRLIIEQPVKTIETIVEGSMTILNAAARYRRPILLTSTSEVYGKSQRVPFSEEDDLVIGPPTYRRWSYATGKALDEFLALAYWHHSRLPVIITRLFNTVGPRQTGQYGMVIPRFVRQAMRNEPITVYGDGKQTRCFTHVKDVVGALRKLMETPSCRGQVFNVGNDQEISIGELAERIRDMTGSESEIRYIPYEEAFGSGFEDMLRRVPDLTKVREAVGYKPQYTLDDILREVIAWMRETDRV